MDLIKVLIVEDELIISEEISEILKKYGISVVGQADNADDALALIHTERPDIVLMDIHIKGNLDGITLAHEVKKIAPIAVIFLTSYMDEGYLTRAKQVMPAAYLVKPFKEQDIISTIEITANNIKSQNGGTNVNKTKNNENQQWLFVKDADLHIKVLLSDILFLEAKGSYTFIQTKSKHFLVAENLKATSAKITSPLFFKVHRSFVVNLANIDSFSGSSIFISGHSITISATFRSDFMDAINSI
uniref:LytR/AlgR family response regulator transcription factor n=1 Tax=Fulvivirga sp. TaxID=1931237 RepID=UPI00404A3AB9